MKNRRLTLLSALVIFALVFAPACVITDMFRTVRENVEETGQQVAEGTDPELFNQARAAYQQVVTKFAICVSEISIQEARRDTMLQAAKDYMDANTEFAAAYRDPLASFGANQQKAQEVLNDPQTSGDLGALLANGATPMQRGLNIALSASVFHEAAMALPDSTVYTNAMWTADEAFSNMTVAMRDCNKAAGDYNAMMSAIPQTVMQALANTLGVSVPPSLPLLVLNYKGEGQLEAALMYPGAPPSEDPFYIPGVSKPINPAP